MIISCFHTWHLSLLFSFTAFVLRLQVIDHEAQYLNPRQVSGSTLGSLIGNAVQSGVSPNLFRGHLC